MPLQHDQLLPRYDIVIVGAGMAGASLGARLAAHGSVLVIEAEDQPGYHATGRSVAFWAETYGGPQVQPLTSASGPLLDAGGFLTPRGALHIGTASAAQARAGMMERFAQAQVGFQPLDGAQLRAAIPGLRENYVVGLAEPSTADIDVAAVHSSSIAGLRRGGGILRTGESLLSAERASGGEWHVRTSRGEFAAGLLVNAAGAWADDIAVRCGVRPLGIAPLRRTVVQLRIDPACQADMPVIMDLDLQFYFKAVGQGRIWLSPHDETPAAASDVAPEDIDVAIAIDRLEHVVDWRIEAVERKWAGLRSFAPDRLPVYGFDVREAGFFWFAGQGGFGIQTAPAAALLGESLLTGAAPDAAIDMLDPARYSPARFG